MAESPSDSSQYWCYHCDKRVEIESIADVVCFECKNGFVESISISAAASEPIDDSAFGEQFVRVLRLIQTARDELSPLNLPSDPPIDEEWNNYDDDEDQSVEIVQEEENDDRDPYADNNNSGGEEEDDDEEEEEEIRDRVLSRRVREIASEAESRRVRILDWAEILMGIEDNTIELRLRIPESDTFVGNPGDYVDAAGYESLLQNLAESDSGGRHGAPPAAKAAVEGLESVVIGKEDEVMSCAICRDLVNVGQIAKNLPCGHGYHGECIVPWLGSRNSCPVCRFELPTDDPEYEEERRKRVVVAGLRAASTSSSAGGAHDSGLE